MSLQSIENAIPHRRPMLLLDEILECTGNKIVCGKTFREDEFFVQGHYPGFPLVPGVILCECALQAGGVLLASLVKGASGVPVVTRMNQVRFRRMIRPGDRVEIQVELREHVSRAYFLEARVICDEKVAVRLEFTCTLSQVGTESK